MEILPIEIAGFCPHLFWSKYSGLMLNVETKLQIRVLLYNVLLNILTIRNSTLLTPLAVVLIVITGAFMLIHQDNKVTAFPQQYQGGNYTFGPISSIQNDESGKPAWIVVGNWKSNLFSNQSSDISGQQGGNATGSSDGSSIDTQINMVRLNGTAAHTHTITNFVLSNMSEPNNTTKVYNGTSTASLREGPVSDIPTSIKIMGDKVISIWLDPAKTDNHYGNTPIYGLVLDEDRHRQGPPKGNDIRIGNSSLG
jgi:hypothetical protein